MHREATDLQLKRRLVSISYRKCIFLYYYKCNNTSIHLFATTAWFLYGMRNVFTERSIKPCNSRMYSEQLISFPTGLLELYRREYQNIYVVHLCLMYQILLFTYSRNSASSCIVKIILSIASLIDANNGDNMFSVNASISTSVPEIILLPLDGKPDKFATTRLI